MTSGVPIMSARGMMRCGFSISPASVDIDSQPEYIHIMIASPRLSDVQMLSPLKMGSKAAPVAVRDAEDREDDERDHDADLDDASATSRSGRGRGC